VSGEVADTARRYREALLAGDLETAVGLLHPDVVLVLPRGTLVGVDDVRAFLAGQSPLENLDVETHAGELQPVNCARVRSVNTQVWRWRESGDVAYERRSEAEYTVRDGKIARLEVRIVA
jgi:ketosteroid isomerase-like protein